MPGCEDGRTFERFTDHARRVLVLAQEEARILGHGFIGTVHLLLGLVHESGPVASVLRSFGLGLETIRTRVRDTIGTGENAEASPPFTPRAKRVLELSLREALGLGHQHIAPEHLLLGLLREGSGLAVQVLVALGIDLERLRQQTLTQLGRPGPVARAQAMMSTGLGPDAMVGARWSPTQSSCSFCGRDTWETDHFVSSPNAVICSACLDQAHEALQAARKTERELFLAPRVFGVPPEGTSLESLAVAVSTALGRDSSQEDLTRSIEDFDELQPFWVLAAEHFPIGSKVVLDRVRFLDDYHATVQVRAIYPGGSWLHHALFVQSDHRWKMSAASVREIIGGFGIATPS